jgi:alpha-galactosidase
MTHFLYEGKDAYPLPDAWIADKGEAYWNENAASRPLPDYQIGQWTPELERAWKIDLSRAAVHQYRIFGLMPIGDTPRRGGWWYHSDLKARQYWYGMPYGGQDTELSWPLYVENLERRVARIARLAQDPKARVSDEIGTTPTREQQVPIIDGLVNNVEGEFQVNVPNRGALEGVADDVVVEVERTLLGIKAGDRSILLWNVLDNHHTQSYEQALAVLEELLSYPGNRELAAHYRRPKNW